MSGVGARHFLWLDMHRIDQALYRRALRHPGDAQRAIVEVRHQGVAQQAGLGSGAVLQVTDQLVRRVDDLE